MSTLILATSFFISVLKFSTFNTNSKIQVWKFSTILSCSRPHMVRKQKLCAILFVFYRLQIYARKFFKCHTLKQRRMKWRIRELLPMHIFFEASNYGQNCNKSSVLNVFQTFYAQNSGKFFISASLGSWNLSLSHSLN